MYGAVDKTSSSFSAHGKIGNFIFIISSFHRKRLLPHLNIVSRLPCETERSRFVSERHLEREPDKPLNVFVTSSTKPGQI